MVDEKKKHPYRYAALAGVLLGLACNLAPVQYQSACEMIARALTLTCGV